MFIGEYEHTLDEKKRVTVPKAFSAELGKKFVVARGLDKCLFVFPQEGWKKHVEQLQQLSFTRADSRDFSRHMLSGAMEISPDAAGRILLTDGHKHFAGLKSKVVFAGVASRVEIWDAAAWKQQMQRVEKDADVLAEKLGDIGIL